MSDQNLATYESYFQYHDPITPQMQRRREPCSVNQIMSQHDLIRTEFFNDFLFKDGLYWGVNLYACDHETNIGDMRVWRGKNNDNFDGSALQILKLLQPAFTGALKRARDSVAQTASGIESKQVMTDSTMQQSSDEWLQVGCVATKELTGREKEIVDLIALGHSDKVIAQDLNIGFCTVRTHIDHIFRKLGVENRMQLIRSVKGW